MSDKLRFKDENGQDYSEWKNYPLHKLSKLYQPKTIQESSFSTTGFSVYGANGIIGFYPQYNHETRQIAMACRGNSCGTINFTKEFSWITGNAMVINTDGYEDIIVKTFLMNQLKHSNLKYLITGGGQPQITREHLKTHTVKVPTILEQQKIADFLSTVDEKIENQKEIVANWEEIKKGLIQKIFSQEIRFKDENGQDYPEWENEILGKLCVTEQKSKYPASYGKNDGLYPFILSNTSNEMKYADTYILNSESIIVNDGGEAYFRYINGKFAYSDHCIVLTTNENTRYIYYYLDANKKIINQKGFVGGGLKNIDRNYLKSFIIKIPSPEEQQKIADFLSTIDEKLDCEKNILNELTELKKGLLQRIFA